MKTKTGKTLSRVLIALSLIAIPAMVVWALVPDEPIVDGKLDPDNEYNEEGCDGYDPGNNPGVVQTGDYSKCYSRGIPGSGGGFYICNDWYDPNEGYDPNGCDGYNIFSWTDTGPNPYMHWQLKIHDNNDITLQQRENTEESQWQNVDPNILGWEQASGYTTSQNDLSTEHPIWELKIPHDAISDYVTVGIIDPKWIDPNACPSGWEPHGYGSAPSPIYPQGGGGGGC